MADLLVTVAGPAGRLDLVVPSDQPVAALVDAIASALGATGSGCPPGDWSLCPLGGDPLPAQASLATAGVRDGAVLVLGADGPSVPPAGRTRRSTVVGVLSATAGVGRTTVAALLARALAAGTGELTVAVDAHPGPASLSERLATGRDVTSTDLLELVDHPALTSDELLGFLSWHGPGLGLLAAGPRRDRAPPLVERDCRRLLDGLARHGLTLVVDCAPGLGDPGTRAVVAAADQIVLVVEPTPSPASRWMARALAAGGLPVIALPWWAPPRPDPSASVQWGDPPGGAGLAGWGSPRRRANPPGWGGVPAAAWEQVWRVAELLVADWDAPGIGERPPGTSNRGRLQGW